MEREKIENKVPPTLNPFIMEGNIFGFSPLFSIVATIVLCIAAVYVLKNTKTIDASLYAGYMRPLSSEFMKEVYEHEPNAKLKKIIADYDKKDYKQAVIGLRSASIMNQNDTIDIYKGIALMMYEKNEEALRAFENLEKKKVPGFYNQIQWYKALNHLKFMDAEKTSLSLNNIIASDDDFAKIPAQKLLQESMSTLK